MKTGQSKAEKIIGYVATAWFYISLIVALSYLTSCTMIKDTWNGVPGEREAYQAAKKEYILHPTKYNRKAKNAAWSDWFTGNGHAYPSYPHMRYPLTWPY